MRYWIGAAIMLAAACGAAAEPPVQPTNLSMIGRGYLKMETVPDSIVMSPAPPASGSAAEARDIEAARATFALRGGPRWALAIVDADLFNPKAPGAFSCAAGVDIGPQTTPKTDKLMRRTMTDLGMSTYVIKRAHQRPRPFMVNGEPSCTPTWEAMLRKDGSYPSGHSAIGYGWGLILAELLPERASQLVARGRAFGVSRNVCNVHWLSDVEEGRIAASATVARLHADPVFRKDVKAAAQELKKVKALPRDCDSEAKALVITP